MGKKQQLSWGIWFCGMAGIFGAALASCLDGTLLSGLGCGLLAALAGAAVWRLVLVNGAALPQLSRGEWLLLSLPGVALGCAVAAVPLTGVLASLFFLLILAAALLVLGRRNAFSLSGVVLAVLLCWFCCYCALSPPCLSPDSYSYYEMSQTLFTDFGRVATIRQYVEWTDYGISFPYFYPLLLAVVDGCTGLGMYSGVVLNIAVGLVSALLLPPVSRGLCRRGWPGVMAAIALLTNRKYLSEVLSGRAIPAAVLCVILLLLLFTQARVWTGKRLFLAGVIAGISMATRFDNLTVVAFVGLCVLLWAGKKRWRGILCYGVGALLPLLPWVVYSAARFGVPWISDNSGTLTMVEIYTPQRFFVPGEEAATLFTDPAAWLHALPGRFHVVALLLLLTFVSTQILLPALLLAAGAVRGRLSGKAVERPRREIALPALILVFYGLKTLAYCLVGYETARYHAETVVMVILALSCLAVPWVSRRLAGGVVVLYLVLALWAGLVYSTPLSQSIRPLCTHPSYASCLNFGYQEQDADWQALWRRVSGKPLLTEQVAHMPDWVSQMYRLVDDPDARVFFISSGGNAYAYGAYTGQKSFASIANMTQTRFFYLIEHRIFPTHIVITDEHDLQWVQPLEERYGLTFLGQVGDDLIYRMGAE